MSDWADTAFGTQADELRRRGDAALTMAHVRARAGHDAGASKNHRVYGIGLWEFQHEELVAAVREVPGARVATLGAYELPVVKGMALFPLKYADRAEPVEHARLEKPVSPLRERLFAAHGPKVTQPYLDESWGDLERSDFIPLPELGDGTELIVVAYACNPQAGVLRVEWGRAEHVGDGELRWGEHSPLPLPTTDLSLTLAGRAGGRFDAGAEPGLDLGLRHPGEQGREVPPQTERHPDHRRAQDT